jgi:hypothetical protein
MFFAPLSAWRHVKVTDRRTLIDFAHCMRELVDDFFPNAEVIRVVLDNLNTHKLAALYEAFEPGEARRILERLEFHFTPKPHSWLNMAETELNVLGSQCLDRRIPDKNFSSLRSQYGKPNAIGMPLLSTGSSPQSMAVSNCENYIRHFTLDRIL